MRAKVTRSDNGKVLQTLWTVPVFVGGDQVAFSRMVDAGPFCKGMGESLNRGFGFLSNGRFDRSHEERVMFPKRQTASS